MTLGGALHQKLEKPQGGTGRTEQGRGEAAFDAVSDEAELARCAQTGWGVDDLLWQALARENVPKFSRPQLLEPPGADPHAGWCGRGPISDDRPLSRFMASLFSTGKVRLLNCS